MRSHAPELLSSWPQDRTVEQLSTTEHLQSLFPRWSEEAIATLEWLKASVRAVGQEEDEDIFDRLYCRAHTLLGFAEIFGIQKAGHLLAVLDFALDHARTVHTFAHHSLGYVVTLLVDTTSEVIRQLRVRGSSERDLGDVVEECATYLSGPFQDHIAPPPGKALPEERAGGPTAAAPVLSAADPPSSVSSAALTDGATARAATPPAAELEDADEALDIPADKVGLISDFCEESREVLARVGHQLIELETAEDHAAIVNDVFRSVHTVKGGARLLEVRKIEVLSHGFETLLDGVRKGLRSVTPELIDLLLEGRKCLERMVDEVASRGPIRTRIGPLLQALAALDSGVATVAVPPSPLPAAAAPAEPSPSGGDRARAPIPAQGDAKKTAASRSTEGIRIATSKLDEVLNTASEIFIGRLRLQSEVVALKLSLRSFKETLQRPASRALSDRARAIDPGSNGTRPRNQGLLPSATDGREFSEHEEMTLNILALEETYKRLQKNVEHLEQQSSRLQHAAMSFRMVPIANLFDPFPTQLRELARQVGKKVRLEISGAQTELDKVLINQLGGPLLHIVRNSVDHGIEAPAERLERGKPEVGRIELKAYYHGSHAVIEVIDDGRGINVERVLAKAIERGLVDAEKAADLTQQEILEFIFLPEFSTAERVSELSGRGVGMDVVKTTISQIQGSVSIDSTAGKGTTLRIKLPLTLAVVSVLLVEEGHQQFAVPILHVDEILTIARELIKDLRGNSVYSHRGATLPITTLSSVLGFPPSTFSAEQVTLVILTEGDKKLGVLVDAVIGLQEVLIKSLGRLIRKVPFVMGCTILSDSRLVLVLNAWELVNAREGRALTAHLGQRSAEERARRSHSILVLDDSAIQRTNLRSVLDHAGYVVDTAENGFEVLKSVRRKRYSAFCVDVVMPLMDGFEFVERLRRIATHERTPVLFITAKTTKRDHDRAERLGVQEYFEKPVDPGRLVAALDHYCLGDASATTSLMGAEQESA